jgi:hypothetical protein
LPSGRMLWRQAFEPGQHHALIDRMGKRMAPFGQFLVLHTLFNIGTSWLWNDIAPTWTMIFSPKGRTFLLFPSIVLNPPWTKAYFLKLQAIEVLGGDMNYSQGGGAVKGESLLTAQFQYNFNLL